MDAVGSTAIRVAWWTEDGSQVSRYSVSCSEIPASKQNTIMVTDVGRTWSVTILDFVDRSINSIQVSQLLPSTSYRCCLVEHYINNTFTTKVCQHIITLHALLQVNCDPPVSDHDSESVDCPNSSHVGSTVSLFVMMLLALLCTFLLVLLFLKQGQDGKKITQW